MRLLVIILAFTTSIFFAGCSGYDVRVTTEPKVVDRGGKGEFRVTFEAKGKYHLEPEGFVLIKFSPPSSIKMDKTEFSQEDKKDGNFISAPFTVTPEAPVGIEVTKVDITFQVCTKTQCLFIEEHKEASVKIR